MRFLPRILLSLLISIGLAFPAHATLATKSGSAKGPKGQRLYVNNVSFLADGQKVTVTGSGYNNKLGIYVAFCEIPVKGEVPETCAGGVNMDGKSGGSVWISSNPPLYGKLLAKKFKTGGNFKVRIKVARKIGDVDCKVSKCGIITRADHTHSENRTGDVFVPVTFK